VLCDFNGRGFSTLSAFYIFNLAVMLVSWWLGFGLLLDVGVLFIVIALWIIKCFMVDIAEISTPMEFD
jgi:hypothetical protein